MIRTLTLVTITLAMGACGSNKKKSSSPPPAKPYNHVELSNATCIETSEALAKMIDPQGKFYTQGECSKFLVLKEGADPTGVLGTCTDKDHTYATIYYKQILTSEKKIENRTAEAAKTDCERTSSDGVKNTFTPLAT